jgi:hypothetical protein
MAQTASKYGHPYFPKTRDPERRWLYRLELTPPNLNIGNPSILSINAQSVTLPTVTVEPIIVPHLNQDVKFAGRPTLGEMTVVFLNAYNADAIDLLEQWLRAVYSPGQEQLGFATNYKADGYLNILTLDFEVWKQYFILGCWPSSIGDKEYDWTVSEQTTRTVTFQVDKVLDQAEGNETTPNNGGGEA